ncbi:TPA: hypothetical protein DF272_06385 [Candidatus Falkowbacteria bacterium]|nr:hypothetical protein [Candidatus Falkowbacteria bacterium]
MNAHGRDMARLFLGIDPTLPGFVSRSISDKCRKSGTKLTLTRIDLKTIAVLNAYAAILQANFGNPVATTLFNPDLKEFHNGAGWDWHILASISFPSGSTFYITIYIEQSATRIYFARALKAEYNGEVFNYYIDDDGQENLSFERA